MIKTHRLTACLLTCLCLLAAPGTSHGYLVASAPEQAFEQAFVWTGFDQGHRLGVAMGGTGLWYGQPLELTVAAPPVASAHPEHQHKFLRVWWQDLNEHFKKTATVELIDRSGQPVEHTLTLLSAADGISSGHRSVVRLTPTRTPGGGMHFPPGKYRLRIRANMNEADADANSYVGTLVTPWVKFEVWSTEPESHDARIKAYLPGIEKQFNDATTPAMRQALEHRLGRDLFDPRNTLLIPALESLATREDENDDEVAAETSESAKRLLRNLLFPIVQLNRPFTPYGQETVVDGPTLGVLGKPSWALIREIENGSALLMMRSKAARHSPLPPHVDLSDPTDEQVNDLAKRLRDEQMETRMAAVRSVGHTADPRIIALLVERFDDPYSYIFQSMPGMPVPTHPVADTAAWQIIQIGEAALPVLLKLSPQLDDRGRWRLSKALVQIGPHPDVLAYFSQMLMARVPNDRHMAIQYLRQLGPKAADVLRPLAEDPTTDVIVRKLSLSALADVDKSEATAKLLRGIIKDVRADAATRAACMYALAEVAPNANTRALLQKIADDQDDPIHETAANRVEALDRELKRRSAAN